jgi:hypothetical protein
MKSEDAFGLPIWVKDMATTFDAENNRFVKAYFKGLRLEEPILGFGETPTRT